MILLGLFMLLVNFAVGGDKNEIHLPKQLLVIYLVIGLLFAPATLLGAVQLLAFYVQCRLGLALTASNAVSIGG